VRWEDGRAGQDYWVGEEGAMRALIVPIALLVPVAVAAQITFERTYGGADLDEGWSAEETDDGGYVIAGKSNSFGAGLSDVYVIRIDSEGDTVWTRTYGGPEDDEAYSIRGASDGGYLIAGKSSSFGAGLSDVYLIRIDSGGDTIWTRTYGGPEDDEAYSIEGTSDGGYIIAGSTRSSGAGVDDVYLIKTDGVGDTVWTKTYGGSDFDRGYSVQETSDGGYAVAGWTRSFGAGEDDVYLVKTGSGGDTVWTRTYGSTEWDYGNSLVETTDGGIVIAGWTSSFGVAHYDLYLIKTDSEGDTVWTRTYGGASVDCGYWVDETVDGGIIIAGYTGSVGAGMNDVYLVKTDSGGDTVWTRTYGGPVADRGYGVGCPDEGGYLIVGYTCSFGAGGSDVYVIKTDADGLVQVSGQCDESLRSEYRYLEQNYPNPFRTWTTISYSLPGAQQVTVIVYDIRGAFVRNLVSGTLPAGRHQVTWDGRDERGGKAPSGIYFCHLKGGEQVQTKRMVLLR
jgi:hypothetical protein